MKHLLLPLLAALLLAAGCQKVVEFDVDELETHVVLNAIPSVDSAMFVNLSYSRFFLDNTQYPPVLGADVTLWVNGTPHSGTYGSLGNYFFPYTVSAGDSLRIQVTLEGRDTVSAATRVPAMPQIDSLTALTDTTLILPMIDIRCILHDPVGPNYYRFLVIERDSGQRRNSLTHELELVDTLGALYFSCTDLNLTDAQATESEALLGAFYGELMCRDVHFDGQDYPLQFSVTNFRDTAEQPGFRRWYYLYVESISPDYYHYRVSLSRANSMTSSFAEPEKLYTNVRNGLGILGAKARRKLPLTITQRPADPTTKTKTPKNTIPHFAPTEMEK